MSLATTRLWCYIAHSFFSSKPMAVELTRKSFTPYAAKKGEEYMNARQRTHFRKILESLKAEPSEEIDRTVNPPQVPRAAEGRPRGGNRPPRAHHAGRGHGVRRSERPGEPGVRHGARASQP